MPELTLADGRTLAYLELGDPGGQPVLALHGTPGSSRQLRGLEATARDRGIRMIAPDRACTMCVHMPLRMKNI